MEEYAAEDYCNESIKNPCDSGNVFAVGENYNIDDDRKRYEENQIDSIRDLGKKTRDRLLQVKSDRREVKRIDTKDIQPQLLGKRSSSSLRLPPTTIRKKIRPKRLSLIKKRFLNEAKIEQFNGKDEDAWMPDVSHLLQASASVRRISDVVQLHGLPNETTPNHIRRFFSGLSINRIIVLLTNNKYIRELDSIHDYCNIGGRPTKPKIERYSPSFRVLVKFNSSSTAGLALKRSGESMLLTVATTEYDASKDFAALNSSRGLPESSGVSKKHVSIAVVPMFKSVAACLVNNLAIDCNISNVPIEKVLRQVEEQIGDSIIGKVLWTATIHDLKLSIKRRSTRSSFDDDNALFPLYSNSMKQPLSMMKENSFIILRRHVKFLEGTIRTIQSKAPYLSLASLDPSMPYIDPVVALISAALKCLQVEADHTRKRLVMAHQWSIGII